MWAPISSGFVNGARSITIWRITGPIIDVIWYLRRISQRRSFHTILKYTILYILEYPVLLSVKNVQTCASEQCAATHRSLEETRATIAAINTVMFSVWSITTYFTGHWCGQSSSYYERCSRLSVQNFILRLILKATILITINFITSKLKIF